MKREGVILEREKEGEGGREKRRKDGGKKGGRERKERRREGERRERRREGERRERRREGEGRREGEREKEGCILTESDSVTDDSLDAVSNLLELWLPEDSQRSCCSHPLPPPSPAPRTAHWAPGLGQSRQ